MVTKPKAVLPAKPLEMSLVGLCFHVFGENREIQRQGIVRGMINENYALVQYFEWMMGDPNTLEIIPIERMSVSSTQNSRSNGAWQFYTNSDHMNSWYNLHYSSNRKKK